MEAKSKKRLVYFFIAFSLILTILLWFFSFIRSESKNAFKQLGIDSTSFSTVPFPEYSRDLSFSKGLDFKMAIYSKTRSPIEKFVYQNDDFFLYKLPVKSNKPFSKMLKIKYVQVSLESNSHYYELTSPYSSAAHDQYYSEHDSYDIFYRPGEPDSGSEINLTLSGDNIKTLKKTDTTYSCYALLGNLSVSYNNFDHFDFYGEKKSNAKLSALPIEIIFEKKKNHYYMMLMIKRE